MNLQKLVFLCFVTFFGLTVAAISSVKNDDFQSSGAIATDSQNNNRHAVIPAIDIK